MRHAALACILGASTMASAQTSYPQPRWGRPTAPKSGACFYHDPGFRGAYFCASSGENIAYMSRGMNDQISSIRTFGVTEVTIFQDARYAGRWTRLQGDVRDLRREGWNDRLSSIRISSGYGRNQGSYEGQSGGQYAGRQNGSGLGRIETAPWREDRADQRDGSGYSPNDRRSDTGVDRYPTDRRDGSGAGQYDPQTRGGATGVDRNNPTDRRDGSGLNRGEPVNPGGSATQDRRVSETTDVTVRRVYQEVLVREADPQGLILYRNHMNNDRWSEQDVRSALLKSPEYLQRNTATPQQAAEQLVALA